LTFRTRNRHRDSIYSGLVQFKLPPRGALRASIAIGPSVIREDTLQETAYQVGPFGTVPVVFGPYGAQTSLTRWTVGATGGVDLGLQISGHMQIVPQVRVHVIERDTDFENGGSSTILGLSHVVFRPGVGLRATW
jgi:hypothetical protein